jgi:hypothetical protein
MVEGFVSHGPGYITKEHDVTCGRRVCTGCRRWRPVSDFSPNRREASGRVIRFSPRCMTCTRIYQRQLNEDAARRASKRERNRMYAESKRREQGVPVRPLKRNGVPGTASERLPVGPLRDHLIGMMERGESTWDELARALGHVRYVRNADGSLGERGNPTQVQRMLGMKVQNKGSRKSINSRISYANAERIVKALGLHPPDFGV